MRHHPNEISPTTVYSGSPSKKGGSYLALLLKVDASNENSQCQETFVVAILIAANVGLVAMVLIQRVVVVRRAG